MKYPYRSTFPASHPVPETRVPATIFVAARAVGAILTLIIAGIAACMTAAADTPDTVLFHIDARDAIAAGQFIPDTQGISVRGGTPPLSWTTGTPASDPDADGIFEAQVLFPPPDRDDQPVAYKFKIEDPDAGQNEGWEEGPNRYFVRIPGGQTVARTFGEAQDPLPVSTTGDVRTHADVTSRFVAPRDVYVYLPPDYERYPDQRYPVLYLHDGQNVFDVRAVGAEWRVDETAERLIRSDETAPFIVVAIANTPDRVDEYTPTRAHVAEGLPAMGGMGNAYGRFIVEEVKPFVDATYRTMPEAMHTALGGSSLGGLISLYLGLQYPGTFGNLLVVSPSIWWDDQLILRIARQLPARTPQRIWLDMGTEESATAIEDARALRAALEANGWTNGANFTYEEDEGADHSESAWAGRVEGMLRFLYGKTP